MRISLHFAVAATVLLLSMQAHAEIVLATSLAAQGPALADQLAPQGRILIANPHTGSVLMEISAGESLFTPEELGKVHRQVENFPTSIPGSVRVMVQIDSGMITREALQDELQEFVEKAGGLEVWRSKNLSRSHYDIPVDNLSNVLAHPLVQAWWFNKPGEPLLAQAVPRIGVLGSKGPGYWPWGGFFYIAVLDTGVIDGAPLAGRVDHTLGACFSSNDGSLASSWVSACPAGPTVKEQYGTGSAYPCTKSQCSHGSYVAAAVVSAVTPKGVISVPNVKILPIQVYTQHKYQDLVVPFEADVARALDYLVPFGNLGFYVSAVVLSMNLGRSSFEPDGITEVVCDSKSNLTGYIQVLKNLKIAVIAAAGNVKDGSTSAGHTRSDFWGLDQPACISEVVSAGATLDNADTVAYNESYQENGQTVFFSSQSSTLLDFWAPGAYITTPIDPTRQVFGTSFSAPLVAGIWTRMRAKYPTQSNAYIKSLLASCSPMVQDNRPNIPQAVTKPRICWRSWW